MAVLILPERFREVLILADRDANRVGQENAHKLAARLRAEGRHAEVRRSTVGKDANDALRARRVG
jgi:Toprim domain